MAQVTAERLAQPTGTESARAIALRQAIGSEIRSTECQDEGCKVWFAYARSNELSQGDNAQ